MKKFLILLSILLMSIALLVGCSSGTSDGEHIGGGELNGGQTDDGVAVINIDGAHELEKVVGESFTIIVTATEGEDYVFCSNNENVAKVDNNGQVICVRPGICVIRVTLTSDETIFDSILLKVISAGDEGYAEDIFA